MSILKKETKKLFYQIGEVAKELDVNVSLIRFWEKEFDIIKPKKNKKGNRLFTQKDFDNLKTIYFLVKEKVVLFPPVPQWHKQHPPGFYLQRQAHDWLKEPRDDWRPFL